LKTLSAGHRFVKKYMILKEEGKRRRRRGNSQTNPFN
jgi:hypothetical protein